MWQGSSISTFHWILPQGDRLAQPELALGTKNEWRALPAHLGVEGAGSGEHDPDRLARLELADGGEHGHPGGKRMIARSLSI